MMRRQQLLFAKAALFRPIFDVLMSKQPGKTSEWARDAALLHKCNVHTPDCWAHLSADKKQKIIGEGLSANVASLLDAEIRDVDAIVKTRKVLVAFGSQTGTAQSYAKMISIFATSNGFVPIVAPMNDVPKILEDNKASKQIDSILFVTATPSSQNGEFPTNAAAFLKDLAAGNLKDSLAGMRYSMMVLGNGSKASAKAVAEKIDADLAASGAKSFLTTQVSASPSEQANTHDSVFRGWKSSIWDALGNAEGSVPANALPTNYDCPIVQVKNKLVARHHYFRGHVQGNVLLTANGFNPASKLLTFTVPIRTQTDELGRRARLNDQIQVHPKNSKAIADRAAKLLGLNLQDCVEITPRPGAPQSFFDGQKMPIETVVRDIIDLSAAPTRTLLDTIASAVPDAAERATLDKLANDLSANSEYDQRLAKGFTIMDMLELCPSLKISLAQLLSIAPQIAPRTYSVAKDNSKWLPEEFEICYNIPTKEAHKGLCTQMMADLQVGDDFLMKFLPDGATVPKNDSPLVIVAIRSGLGTARSLIHRRKIAKADGEKVGPVVLYYGFRETGKDQLFTKELNEWQKEGLVEVRYVPSSDVAGQFVTPMDKLDASVASFLGANGEFSYCGLGGSVPVKVEAALKKCGVDTAALRASGRYHEEYFSVDPDFELVLKTSAQ